MQIAQRVHAIRCFRGEPASLLCRPPTPGEIPVESAGFLHWTEQDGNFDEAVEIAQFP